MRLLQQLLLTPACAAGWLALVSLPLAGAAASPLQPCRLAGLSHEAQCGHVLRPLDTQRPAGTAIQVQYVVVPALARRKRPDPVFLLAGGPGQSAIALAPALMPLFARLNQRRDIVFVDQRGTGRSAPLACNDDDATAPLAERGDEAAQLQQLERCRAQWRQLPYAAAPGDLSLFTTWLAMQDLDAVRAQLGAERINLVGASYGTRAALDYQRQFPSHVRRSVLDGVAPPDMALPASSAQDAQAALDALFAACDAEAACQRRHPQLRADWHGLLRSLPRRIMVNDPLRGTPQSFVLQRDTLLAAVRGPLYSPVLASALPQALHEATQGRFAPLFALGSALAPSAAGTVALGMHFSVVCNEDMAVANAGQAPETDFGSSHESLYRRACARWPRAAVPAAFFRLQRSNSPVLLLSGGADPATPPRHAARVAAALGPLARHIVAPQAGHGLLGVGCAPELMTRFLDAEDDADALAVDASCLTRVPRPPAFIP